MNFAIKFNWIIFLSLIFHVSLQSQETSDSDSLRLLEEEIPFFPDIVLPSPEAASFGKFIDTPVDVSTGVPSIEIPIAAVNHGSISMDVVLRYHAGGLRVSDLPGLVGAGWNLFQGGYLGRTVQGLVDESGAGYYNTGSTFNPNSQADIGKTIEGVKDGEPDIFNFTIPGYSGKFYFNENQEVVLIPKMDLKVEQTNFQRFIITDPNGTKYYFGRYADGDPLIVDRTDVDAEESAIYVTGWHLVRINSFDDLFSIVFNYSSTVSYSYAMPNNCREIYHLNAPCGGPNMTSNCPGDDEVQYTVDTHKLESITSPTQTVTFTISTDASTEGLQLDNINVATGTYSHEFDFTYDTSIGGDRRTLTKLEKKGTNVVYSPYDFEYYSPVLPDRISEAIDHWGFYNGTTGNESENLNIPESTIGQFTRGGADRNPNVMYAIGGTLKKITYPAGGTKEFEFELNEYAETGDDFVDGGGLRIGKITVSDNIVGGNDIVEEYEYEKDSKSSGRLLFFPSYAKSISGTLVQNDIITSSIALTVFSEESMRPLSSFEGRIVSYERVTKKLGSNRGYTIYNLNDEFSGSDVSYPAVPSNMAILSGKVDSEVKYNSSNIAVNTMTYDHIDNSYDESTVLLKGVAIAGGTCESGQGSFIGNYTIGIAKDYDIRTNKYQLESKTNVLDGVSTITNYAYRNDDVHLFPISEIVENSNGKDYKTEYIYTSDATSGINNTVSSSYNIKTPTEVNQYVDDALVDGTRTLYANFTVSTGTYPYPKTYKRHEETFNASNVPLYPNQFVINTRDAQTGLPTSITKPGWQPFLYVWDSANANLLSRSFNAYSSTFEYHLNTSLVKKATKHDNTFLEYNYDNFFRLKEVEDDIRGATTTIGYNLDRTNNYKSISTEYETLGTEYTDHILKTVEFYDGLARPIQIKKVNQGTTDTQSTANKIVYDEYGKNNIVFEVIQEDEINTSVDLDRITSGFTDFVEYKYELNPLDRLQWIKDASGNFTYYDFGRNSSGEGGYNANTLRYTRVRDSEQVKTTEYFDRIGNKVFQINGKNPIEVETAYSYDLKNRLISIDPPGALSDSLYHFTYYGNDLLKSKDLPDKGRIDYNYDNRDLLVRWQDGRMREGASGIFNDIAYEYDTYGRITKVFNESAFQTISNHSYVSDGEDGEGNIKEETTWLLCDNGYCDGNNKEYFYDESARLVEIQDATTQLTDGFFINGPFRQSGRTKDLENLSVKLNADGSIEKFDLLNKQKQSTSTCQNLVPTITYSYDSADNMIEKDVGVCFNLITNYDVEGDVRYIGKYSIDHAGRSEGEEIALVYGMDTDNIGSYFEVVDRDYTAKGQLSKLSLGGGFQDITYTYKSNNWIESINSPGLIDMSFSYLANGNITDMDVDWFGAGEYNNKYEYDELNRISSFKNIRSVNNSQLLSADYTYDARGNIQTLERTRTPFVIDNLQYQYESTESNRVEKVTDNAGNAEGFNQKTSGLYDYDGNGNIIQDPSKSVNGNTPATITYNYLNLPGLVDFGNEKIQFYYKADGTLYKKEMSVNGNIRDSRIYFDDIEFKLVYDGNGSSYSDVEYGRVELVKFSEGYLVPNAECNDQSNLRLTEDEYHTNRKYGAQHIESTSNIKTNNIKYKAADQIHLTSGFHAEKNNAFQAKIQQVDCQNEIDETLNTPFYTIKDHLGNNVVELVDDGNGNPAVLAEHKYFPFGVEVSNSIWDSNSGNEFNYLHNNQELHDDFELGYYNYGARFYDPAIARWTSVDPIAMEYAPISTYAYVANMPTQAIDPDGRRILFINGYWNGWIGGLIGSSNPGKRYWGSGFTQAAQKHFGDYSNIDSRNYIDGSSLFGGDQSGADRKSNGYAYAKKNYSSLVEGLAEGETFKLVTHSEGAAYGSGIAEYLMERGHEVESILNLSPDEPDEFSSPENTTTYQLDYNGDWVTGSKGAVSGTDLFGVVDKFESKSDQFKFAHGSTKSSGVFKDVQALLQTAASNAVGIKVNSIEDGVKFTFIRDKRDK